MKKLKKLQRKRGSVKNGKEILGYKWKDTKKMKREKLQMMNRKKYSSTERQRGRNKERNKGRTKEQRQEKKGNSNKRNT
jgi:hypothetical protein